MRSPIAVLVRLRFSILPYALEFQVRKFGIWVAVIFMLVLLHHVWEWQLYKHLTGEDVPFLVWGTTNKQ
jgi:hypothetical protein